MFTTWKDLLPAPRGMLTPMQGLVRAAAPKPPDVWLDDFLAEGRGVLRMMTTETDRSSRGENILTITTSHGGDKEFRIINADAAADAYRIIVDYFKRHGHNTVLHFEYVDLYLYYGNFNRRTDDLKRDLGLLEFELPTLPDTIDLNAEATRLGLSPETALKALQQAAAREARGRAKPRTQKKSNPELTVVRLKAAYEVLLRKSDLANSALSNDERLRRSVNLARTYDRIRQHDPLFHDDREELKLARRFLNRRNDQRRQMLKPAAV